MITPHNHSVIKYLCPLVFRDYRALVLGSFWFEGVLYLIVLTDDGRIVEVPDWAHRDEGS